MIFDIVKTIKLDFLGAEWRECYLSFYPISVREAKLFATFDPKDPKAVEKGLEVIQNKFVEGKGISKGKMVTITKETLNDLPLSVMMEAVSVLTSSMDNEKKMVN